jgi:amino acid adenylation domain-containing protein
VSIFYWKGEMEIIENKEFSNLRKVNYNPFVHNDESQTYLTTNAQQELWASIMLDENATLCYNECLCLEMTGDLNTQYLEKAFTEIVKRHAALRSVFSKDGKSFIVQPVKGSQIEFHDFTDSNRLSLDLESLKQVTVASKFDLQNGPCYRAMLVKCSKNLHTFLFSAHHLVADGWSFAICINELSEIYNHYLMHNSRPLSIAKAPSFTKYTKDIFEKGETSAHKKYWMHEFSSLPKPAILPTDFKRPVYRTFESKRLDFVLDEKIVLLLKKCAREEICSFYHILYAGFALLQYKLTGQSDSVIGISSAAQASLVESSMVGHMVNLLPIRIQLDEEMSLSHFLKLVKSKMLDAFDHQDFSFGELVKNLPQMDRDPARIPLLCSVFNIDQQAPDQGVNFQGLKTKLTTIPRNYENFELFVNAVQCGNKLTFECQYSCRLFKAETITHWMNSFLVLLEKMTQTTGNSLKHYLPLDICKSTTDSICNVIIESKKDFTRNLAIEIDITQIWSDVLFKDKSDVKPEDNFFSLGGHSLLAAQVINKIAETYFIEITVRDLFENPTIAGLSRVVELKKIKCENSITRTPLMEVNLERDVYPISYSQLQIWYLEELIPATNMHNLPSAIRIKHLLNRDVLEEALNILIERHPAFRTLIESLDGGPVQRILNKEAIPRFQLELILLKESELVDALNKEALIRFDKTKVPLFRAKLYNTEKNDSIFFFMVHHSIFDGWSFDIFFEELNTVYSSLLKNNLFPEYRNPVIARHTDYTLWLLDKLENGDFEKSLKFWEEKLKAPLTVLDLPIDFKRPRNIEHIGGTIPFVLSTERKSALQDFAKRNDVSLFNLLLSLFKLTLFKYTANEEIIVGLPVRSRPMPEVLNTIGYFVNTIAIRSSINPMESFQSLLKNISKNCIETMDHELVPFQVVLGRLKLPRDSSRTPVFQTFFSFQDIGNRNSVIDNHPYTQINIDKSSTHTDLDLWIKASENKIEGAFEFRKDLFLDITVERFKETFLQLLDAVIVNDQIPLKRINALCSSQKNILLHDWNLATISIHSYLPMHKVFEENVLIDPKKIAVETADESLSYLELEVRANKCANALIAKGIKKGDLVGISMPRNVHLVVALMGVLKSGAGYLPLDPAFPEDRLNFMIEEANPKLILTEELVQEFLGFETNLKSPNIAYNVNDVQYVIYTSGSTGKPKGVEVSQKSVLNFLSSMRKKGIFYNNDKILAVTTLSFDISVLEIFLPLFCGGTLYLAKPIEAMDGNVLRNIIETKSITVMQATPSSWRLLLASGWKGGVLKALCGGEAFPIDLAREMSLKCLSVWNMYGPTETTVWSACKKLSANDEYITVGKPIDNTTLYILDEERKLVPIGASGELYIGGAGVANGYFLRDELTDEKFISNPFMLNERMYATGDMARFTHDGDLLILGRKDSQVKVRGFRIELEEIEACLSDNVDVVENAVVCVPIESSDIRIVGFIKTKRRSVDLENDREEERKLRDSLKKKLPHYMIPNHFIFIEDLPKTPNAKIDKKTLILKAQSLITSPTSSIVAPLTQKSVAPKSAYSDAHLKESLRKIWQNIIGSKIVLDNDNFFEIGGNSLMAVQIYSKIGSEFKVSPPLSFLIEAENFISFFQGIKALLGKKDDNDVKQSNSSVPTIFKTLVAIKNEGTGAPLFCFHGVGGNILNYTSLIAATEKRPLMAFQSLGLDGRTLPIHSIEEMANEYIKEMLIVQPHGPYLLAGGSMGGMIAFEVAVQLINRGEKIEKLIMFDTFGPNLNLKSYCKDGQNKKNFFKRICNGITYRSKVTINSLQVNVMRALGLIIPLSALLFHIESQNYKAIWKYRPKHYKGDLYLLRSKHSDGWYSDPVMGWKGIIDGAIRTFEIEGVHANFIESPELPIVLRSLI